MTIYIYDTETNGLLDVVDKFHCLVFSPIDKDKFFVFCDYSQIEMDLRRSFEDQGVQFFDTERYIDLLNSKKTRGLICHNQLSYDLEVMRKLDGIKYDYQSINGRKLFIADTLVMSRYLNPERQAPEGMNKKQVHGLEPWGVRLGIAKPSVEDWKSQDLSVYINRCIEDVKINKALYFELLKEMNDVAIPNGNKIGDWKKPIRMAHKVSWLMYEQERTGVVFDIEGAKRLIERIDKEMKEIADEIEPLLGERELPVSQQPTPPENPWKKPFNFDSVWTQKGELRKPVVEYLNKIGYTDEENQKKYINQIDENTIQLHHSLLTSNAISYGEKIGVTNIEELHKEFLRLKEGGKPKILIEKLCLSHKKTVKEFLIKGGWKPTMWKFRNITIEPKGKKKLTEEEINIKLDAYIKEFEGSVYWPFILEDLGYKKEYVDTNTKAFRDRCIKKGRELISSPQYKDQRGELCKNLEKMAGDTVKKIVRWLSLQNRCNTILSENGTGWLAHPRLQIDGRLSASSSGITPTKRQKHHIICNIPKPSDDVVLGKEMRNLFISPDEYYCCGVDAAGIEGRCMAEAAWNFDDGAYAEEILNGDIHSKNAEAFSEAVGHKISRSDSKSPYYGALYGCQAKKMAKMLSVEEDKGQAIIDALWAVSPGLKMCKDALERYWEMTGKKYLMGIDGSKIFTRSKHSLLNSYLQSSGALIMDWACCYIEQQIKKENLIGNRYIFYHDEVGFYIPKKDVKEFYFDIDNKPEEHRDNHYYSKPKIFRDGNILHYEPEEKLSTDKWIQWYTRVGEICIEGIKKAGQYFGFRVPLEGQIIIGYSWGTTH